MEMADLLVRTINEGGSDLFLSVDAPPLVKVEGQIHPIGKVALGIEENRRLIYSVLNDRDILQFEQSNELNKSLGLPKVGRFRINVFRQKGEPALVARYVKDQIPDFAALGMPPELANFAEEKSGLVLVVGATGSGKSTTLASMIDYRNSRRSGHILTVEDPIEFVHHSKKSLVNQREVGIDTESFETALKNGLREAPDVILIGELRDRDTAKHAITYADTGHLCLASLHATNATQALQRILNFFPEEDHVRLQQDLSLNLRAVIAQRLCERKSGGRVAAVEVMVNTPYIADLIEKGNLFEVPEAMNRSKGRACRTFDDALYDLMTNGTISEDEALRNADSRNNLSLRFRMISAGATETYPIESEYVVAKLAPFDQYHTFKVTPVRVDEREPDAADVITAAIEVALEQKGLTIDTVDPDIDVQFVFDVKSTKGLGLTPVAGADDHHERFAPKSDEHTLLVISVVDCHRKKPVYRLSASRQRLDHQESDVVVNQHFVELLSSLPVGDDAPR